MFAPEYRCLFAGVWSTKGYSNMCGLSFDLAVLKHTAPPTLVPSCIHMCAVAQMSLLPPQAAASDRGHCPAQTSAPILFGATLNLKHKPHVSTLNYSDCAGSGACFMFCFTGKPNLNPTDIYNCAIQPGNSILLNCMCAAHCIFIHSSNIF